MKHDNNRQSKTTRRTLLLIVPALLVAGCATAGTRPDDMSAAAHRRAAKKEELVAARHSKKNQPSGPVSVGSAEHAGAFAFPIEAYDPSHAHAAEAARHRRHATQHAEAALILERFERAECKTLPKKTRILCPLMGQLAAVTDDDQGVVLTLASGVPPKAILAHMRCHHAFGRSAGHKGMDRCPLYLRGVEMGLTRDGKRVFVHTTKTAAASTLTRLRHRMRAHLPAPKAPAR